MIILVQVEVNYFSAALDEALLSKPVVNVTSARFIKNYKELCCKYKILYQNIFVELKITNDILEVVAREYA